MNSEVWINGQFLGRRPYGFVGFRYDLTEFLNTNGSPNVLAVRVDDSLEPSLRWYAGSGIYRHVRLITTGYTHFRLDGGIRITTPRVTPGQATVEANYIIDAHFFTDEERQAWLADVWNAHPTNREVVLRSSVLAPDGAVVASAESESRARQHAPRPARHAAAHGAASPASGPTARRSFTVCAARWRSTAGALDETVTTFGIRQLKFDPDRGLLVNGKPIKLKGVCLHQDAGSFGNAVPAAVWAWRLARLKEMGCNAVRTSHHPFAPEFYDLCDQLGFYVFDEAFDEWTRDWPYNFTENPRGKSKYGYHLYFNQWHDTDLRAMLRRDRNHPCVVLYSIGNEIPNQLDHDGWKIASELVAICHEEDPTRPATSACDQSYVSSRNGFMDSSTSPAIITSTASTAPIPTLPNTRVSRTASASAPKPLAGIHYWLGVRDHDYVIGEFIWTGIDYLGESHDPRRGNGSGFLDLAGGRKPGSISAPPTGATIPCCSSLCSPARNLSWPGVPRPGFIKWNWPAGAQLTVRAAANCDEVELFLNNRSLGRHAVSARCLMPLDWTVPYAPGTLSAVGYRAGRRSSLGNCARPARRRGSRSLRSRRPCQRSRHSTRSLSLTTPA